MENNTITTKKEEAKDLLNQIEGLNSVKKQIILAAIKGMLIAVDVDTQKGA